MPSVSKCRQQLLVVVSEMQRHLKAPPKKNKCTNAMGKAKEPQGLRVVGRLLPAIPQGFKGQRALLPAILQRPWNMGGPRLQKGGG
mmetsp:Transcript_76314/g.127189  ORF Transcript_76314/g.127189 Transcript_76314/m.127189 type:complete len:86 (+) Transcript_76314:460-717(+)